MNARAIIESMDDEESLQGFLSRSGEPARVNVESVCPKLGFAGHPRAWGTEWAYTHRIEGGAQGQGYISVRQSRPGVANVYIKYHTVLSQRSPFTWNLALANEDLEEFLVEAKALVSSEYWNMVAMEHVAQRLISKWSHREEPNP